MAITRKVEVFDKVSKQPVSEGETFRGAVKPLTDRNDSRIADDLAEWFQVRLWGA